jgi:lipoprotein-anchoring transpeptidase ErfK/SrfK
MVRVREFAAVALTVSVATGAATLWQGSQSGDHPFARRSMAAVLEQAIAVKPMHFSRFTPRIVLADGPELPADAKAEAERPPEPIVLDPKVESAMAQDVAARLARKVPERLTPYFDLYFYVSKSAAGPWAQRLFIFRKTAGGTLDFEESFPVSTGRERDEKYFTATPTGFFQLDPNRFMPLARSAKWNDALMPWAMFLNYSYRTQMSGVALHAAIGRRELADLGHRASGGCVRLPLDKANGLYHRIKATMGGSVPVFAFDEERGTTSTSGEMLKDAAGNVLVASGYRVLVVIDGYAGEEPRSS